MSNHHTTRSALRTWRRTGASFLTVVALVSLTACGGESEATEANLPDGVRSEVTLGVTDIDNAWETFVDIAERDYGIDVELVLFSDIILPNEALANEEIDANAFQHVLYLAEFSHANHLDLETVGVAGATTVGLYSQNAQDLEDIPHGGKIMMAKGMKSHNRRKKSPRVKRKFDKMFEMDSTNAKNVRRMLPNGLK